MMPKCDSCNGGMDGYREGDIYYYWCHHCTVDEIDEANGVEK